LAWLDRAEGGGLALDLACGRGRHCEALLGLGYRVVAVDIAAAALRELRRIHHRSTASIMAVQADLDAWPFPSGVFDLILQCDFLDRRLFGPIKDTVRAGGHVLVDTFRASDMNDTSGPRNRDYLLQDGELLDSFDGWEILRHATSERPMREAVLVRKPSILTRSSGSATRKQ
jgi:SAM-dependent methyltransferase